MERLELVQQIKFALSRLGDSNSHHDFESICLEFARRRISVNFLPATGPVSALGDQGRDGETFWSNLGSEGAAVTSWGTSIISGQSVVIACTLQSSGLRGKVIDDLRSITSRGTPVDRVAYFLNAPMPSGLRHEIVDAAHETFDVGLDVFDLEALSEHLADFDLFWIASEYLHIPSDAGPPVPTGSELPEWYLEVRARWRSGAAVPSSFGDFAEISILTRAATFVPEARPDLAQMIELLEGLAGSPDPELAWRASYEICVAIYRGLNDFERIEARLVSLVELAIDGDIDPSLLLDANVLLHYAYGAAIRGLTGRTLDEWDELYSRLEGALDEAISEAATSNLRVLLYSVQAMLAFMPNYTHEMASRVIHSGGDEIDEGAADDSPLPVAIALKDRDRGMTAMTAVLAELPRAPMFPVTSTAETFDLITMSLIEHPDYETVRDGLERALSLASGDRTAAERANRRAYLFARADEPSRAAHEARTASLAYWRAHEVGSSSQMMIFEADMLSAMGLHVAAKARYLAAAWAAGTHVENRINALAGEAFVGAGAQDYFLGNWATSAAELVFALNQHAIFAPDAANVDQHEFLESAVQMLGNIVATARTSDALWSWLEGELESTATAGFGESMAPLEQVQSLAEHARESGLGAPFSDVLDTREIAWKAMGAEWRFKYNNDRQTVLAAERLVARLQALLWLLAEEPLELLPVRVEVLIVVGTAASTIDEKIVELARGESGEIRFEVALTREADSADRDPEERQNTLTHEATLAAIGLIYSLTLVSAESLKKSIGRVLDAEQRTGSPAVRLYDDTAGLVMPEWNREPEPGFAENLPFGSLTPAATTALVAVEGLSSSFDRESAVRDIANRYAQVEENYWRTLPRVLADSRCMALLRGFRDRGYRDWHLLSALSNLIGNQRVEDAGISLESRAGMATAERLMRSREAESGTDFPLDQIDEESMATALSLLAHIVSRSYGLESRLKRPDLDAIEALLVEHFAYFQTDAPHVDTFGWNSPEGHSPSVA